MQLIAPNRSYLSYVFLQVGKIKEFCANNDNRIRKVRLGVDIIDKRILDSCKFISDRASEYGLVHGGSLFLATGRV